MHQIEQEEPECSTVDDTFYVDGVEPVDVCVDTVYPQAEVRDEGFVTIQIHNEPIEMKVDTGAKCNVMSKETFDNISSGQIIKSSKTTNLVAYGGNKIQTSGLVMLPCCLDRQQHMLPFFLVERDVVPLLGFRAYVCLGLVTLSPHVHQISTENNTVLTEDIFEQYKDVFSDELGELPITYHLLHDLGPNSTASCPPSTPHPLGDAATCQSRV